MPSNHLILCHPLLLLSSVFPSIRVISKESVLHIRWPKYRSFSFSITPSNEYSGLISFRMESPRTRDSQESSPTPQFKNINSLVLSFLYGPTLTSIHGRSAGKESTCNAGVSEVAQSCPTLCNPIDCSLSGSSIHGIFQARVLEWVAIAFCTGK